MSHVDPELLALLALGEEVASAADREHLAACPDCAADLQNLARTAAIARTTIDEGALIAPSRRVWHRISDELSLGEQALPIAPVDPIRSRPKRAWVRPLVAAAAAVAVVTAGVVVWASIQDTPATVLARASLDAFPGWSGSSGSAVVETSASGERTVQVELAAPVRDDDYREVWLITSDTTELISLGIVTGDQASFSIPADLDLSRYDLVDISSEPYDGDPTHSGDSIVRGQLG